MGGDSRHQAQAVGQGTARRRWLTTSVVGFGLASFLSDMGHEAATSALPALLMALGAPPMALGLIEGVSDGCASFAKLAGGWLADRPHHRKPLAVLGYLVTGLAGLFAVAGLTLAFEDTLEGTITAAEVPSALRGTGYGVLATVNGVGDLLSSSLVGVVWTVRGPGTAFGAAAVLCLLGTLTLVAHNRAQPQPEGLR